MQIEIDGVDYESKLAKIRLIAENQVESALLVVIGKRIKKPVETWGLIGRERTILDIRIPLRKQKANDDEFGN